MAFLVATVRIQDPDAFSAYLKAIEGVSERFGGEYVCRGRVSEVLEGAVQPDERVVVVRFPSEHAARSYTESAEYLAGKALRQGGATVEMRLIS